MLIGVGNGYIIKRRNNKFSSNIHRGNVYTTKDYGIEVIFALHNTIRIAVVRNFTPVSEDSLYPFNQSL